MASVQKQLCDDRKSAKQALYEQKISHYHSTASYTN